MATIANLKVNVGADADQLISEMKRVEKSIKESEKGFKQFQSTAVKAVTAIGAAIGASNIAGKIINVSAEFESLRASLETVFGSQEAAALQFRKINDFASQTPFTIQEITEAAIRLKGLGLDPSIESLTSFGNTASALSKPLMQFVEAVGDAAVGEFERLKEFNIATKSEGDKVKFTFQGLTTEIGKNSREITDYLLGIGNTQYAGAIEKQAETLNGVFSTLGGAVDSLAVKLGEETGLTNAVKVAAKAMTDFINQLIGEKSLPQLMDELAEKQEKLAELTNRVGGVHIYASQQVRSLRKEIEDLNKEIEKRNNEPTIGISGGRVDPKTLPSPILGMTRDELEEDLMKLEESLKSKELLLQEKTQNELNILIDAENQGLITKQKFLMLEKDLTLKSMKELGKIRSNQAEEDLKTEEQKFRALISSASTSSKAIFEINKVLAISDAILGAKEAVLGAYKVGSKIGGPPLGALYAGIAAAATAAQVASIASSSFGGGGGQASVAGGAVPTDNQESILDAANDEPQQKTVFLNIEGIDDEAFLSKNQVRAIVDQINEERDSNVRIVI